MGTKLGKQTRRELLEALRERYRNASKFDKTKILDEVIDIAGLSVTAREVTTLSARAGQAEIVQFR